MSVKSFYGKSIKEALDKARREMGADAAIVASRQMRPDEGGGCEVVCSTDALPSSVRQASVMEPPSIIACESKQPRRVARLRKRIEALVTGEDDGFESDKVRTELLSSGFSVDLANEIVAGVRQRQRQGSECTHALREELARRIACAPSLGRRIIAFVGPSGVGKTTSLVKLAVRYGLRGHKPMHIVSMDSWRVGGTDALRTYAAGMGVTFEALETAEALRQSLEEHSGSGLILIDTPGIGPVEQSAWAPLASLLSRRTDAEVHLVLSAAMSPKGLLTAAHRFRSFLPSKLLITGADCVDTYLPVVALSLLLEKPFSYVATGQIIPDDLEEASPDRLLGHTMASEKLSATTAA